MLVNSLPNLEQNMGFKVVLAGLSWILETLPIISSMNLKMSEQAATSVANDMEHTIERLSYMAGGLKLCDDPTLCDLGYRTIHFKRHNYFMLYHIQDDMVYIDAIYHDLQNYEDFKVATVN